MGNKEISESEVNGSTDSVEVVLRDIILAAKQGFSVAETCNGSSGTGELAGNGIAMTRMERWRWQEMIPRLLILNRSVLYCGGCCGRER